MTIKELGSWVPCLTSSFEGSDNGSEEDSAMDGEDEEQGDSNSEDMQAHGHSFESQVVMEEGEIRPEVKVCAAPSLGESLVDGLVEEIPDETDHVQRQNATGRWGEAVELGTAVLQELNSEEVGRKSVREEGDMAVATEEGSAATPSRPPGFSNFGLRLETQQELFGRSRETVTGVKKKRVQMANSTSTSLGSKGNDLINLLNGIRSDTSPEIMIDNMKNFIDIGVSLGYDMSGCEETMSKLLNHMGELKGFT